MKLLGDSSVLKCPCGLCNENYIDEVSWHMAKPIKDHKSGDHNSWILKQFLNSYAYAYLLMINGIFISC